MNYERKLNIQHKIIDMFKFRFTILQCERVSELLGVRGGNHSVQGSRLRECWRRLLMF